MDTVDFGIEDTVNMKVGVNSCMKMLLNVTMETDAPEKQLADISMRNCSEPKDTLF